MDENEKDPSILLEGCLHRIFIMQVTILGLLASNLAVQVVQLWRLLQ